MGITSFPTSVTGPGEPFVDQQHTPLVERVTEELERPSLDDRLYRVIRLSNELEALLVHDAETDKASASLDVNVGAFSDPDDMPGMAHAVEHLLFMGTEKYPVENAYSDYLSKHSGRSNAGTGPTSTTYYFDVAAVSSTTSESAQNDGKTGKPDGKEPIDSPLYGALDRFAQFFIAPLFLSSTLDRELNAVDSENKKNLQKDGWRLRQLQKSLSNRKHPYCHFSTGNLETLRDTPKSRGVEIRGEFMKFHKEHYSANRMKLVVLGRQPLDELEDMVNELFSPIPNKDLPQNRWDDEQPLTEKELLTQISARPVMESRTLSLVFPYLDEENLFESQPGHYLAHLIGHEGPGSILAYIKAKGWANSLSAGMDQICPGAAHFSVSVRLTEDGLANYREIVKVIFQYIALLRDAGPQEWVFDELKGMAEVDFRFRQKSAAIDFAQAMSSVMQKPYPREWLLSGSSLMRRFDPDIIAQATGYLRPDNFRISLISQSLEGLDQKERWYGTEYKNEKIPEDFLEDLKRAGLKDGRLAELSLPHKNEFIPKNLEVDKKEIEEPSVAPRLIRNDGGVRIWWKKDDQFWVPKGNVYIALRSPLVTATVESSVRAQLYTSLVQDALEEYSYDAQLSGLDYTLYTSGIGLNLMISGYSDKMYVLLEKVCQYMRNLEVKPDRFEILKERKLRAFRNWAFQEPYKQVSEYASSVNSEDGWTVHDYLDELPSVTADDVREFYPQLLRQLHVESLVHGNFHREDALRLTDLVVTTLRPRALPQSQWTIRRAMIFPPGGNYLYPRTLEDPANVNNCIELLLYIGLISDRLLRAKLALFSQMTSEPVFDQLRTKEQLGYAVFSQSRETWTTMSYMIIIQGGRSPEYLDERIEAFIESFAKSLREMSTEDFNRHKGSLITRRTEKLRSLGRESSRFWSHINSEFYDFYKVDEDVKCINSLSKEDIIDLYGRYIKLGAPSRSKLSIHLKAKGSSASDVQDGGAEEKKEKVLLLLGQYLNAQGVAVEQEVLQKRMEHVDVAKGDQAAIKAAIQQHLATDLKLPSDRVEAVLAEGAQLLAMALPSLGITVQPEADEAQSGEAEAEAKSVSDTQAPAAVIIKDVREFKAGLEISAGARPVEDLSRYEELESKL
ncbi:MAG: hypothetical protein M1825_001671 [Sarcosagium campestre]|nr:MAG: hypothetical protein M1825_001671 [Sarcosagium campestre]